MLKYIFTITVFALMSAPLRADTVVDLRPFPIKYEPRFAPQLVAHRGMLRFAPENTILSMEIAYRRGFRFIEIDVVVTRDGEFLVFHDRHLRRLGKDIGVCDIDLEEIKKETPAVLFFSDVFGLSREQSKKAIKLADPWVAELQKSTLPSLDEVFSKFGQGIYYHLDLKSLNCKQERILMTHKLLELVSKHSLERHVFIESQDPGILSLIKALNSSQLVLYWRDDIHRQDRQIINYLETLKFDGIDHSGGTLDGSSSNRIDGIYLFTFTINSLSKIERLRPIYDFILTDLDAIHKKPLNKYEFFNSRSSKVKILRSAADPKYKALVAEGFQEVMQTKHAARVLLRE